MANRADNQRGIDSSSASDRPGPNGAESETDWSAARSMAVVGLQGQSPSRGSATLNGSSASLPDDGGEPPPSALVHERRRIAADLHDLVMQDLAFALASARTLTDGAVPPSQASAVIAAGERALTGARQLLADLSTPDRRLVVDAVEASVRLAARDVTLSFDADGVPAGTQPNQAAVDALVHVGREAVTNAIKHANPSRIQVVLRRTDPDRPRPFRTPFVPVLPLVSVAFCLYLMLYLPVLTWIRFAVWLLIGAAIYFSYGIRHSRVRALSGQ